MYFAEFDNPELEQALQEEQQLQQQMKAEQAEQQKTAAQLQAAGEAAEIQIKAEREASRNRQVDIQQQDADTKRADVAAKERIAKDNRGARDVS